MYRASRCGRIRSTWWIGGNTGVGPDDDSYVHASQFDENNPDDERADPHSFGDVWTVKDR